MTGISRQWRVRREATVLKWAVAAGFAVFAAVLREDVRGMLLCAGGALLFAGFALRDTLAPVRLAADDHGVTVVTGLASRLQVPWTQITHIRVARHARYGLRWDMLEVETKDGLHLFSSHELGVPCDTVADELFQFRWR
ncbi:PH domain-containing protein [Sphaerisporangium sp. TRM90804]|uniref:PH domain-containing protein n=1 Tax=Sphaerisporangium sp. TRM90804 TaxID=3031113 RepID=UPI002449BAE8|nr:PH domain-containing protein [Sphaerisporangium sp. TRM90804]MDH2424892.1 PH domain-containing protein [Sphaerisporangium sp. TRM90804]